jgi:DNA-binding NtrC family response regulator
MLALPARGAVTLGRSEEADLRIDDRSVSRHHATLHLGETVQLEDHGSANGTRVRGAPVASGARVAVRVGDVIELGTVLCALAGSPVAPVAPAPQPAGDIVIEDPAMVRLHALVDRVADGAVHVLLLGETGSGKEVFAERLHRRSPRRDHPYVKVNCAALTETLFESELFGYEKGAFSGAVTAKPGIIETAEGGTLFLDEVGELTPALQAKLLRVLEDAQVRRVGGLKSRPVNVRIVAATNRDLEAEAAAGRYRSDLYFRLNGFALTIPPLRERVREIAPLARHFAAVSAAQSGRPVPTISPEAMRALEAYRWPGNIRELRNVIARAALLSSGTITTEHLPLDKMRPAVAAPSPAAPAVSAPEATPLPDDLRDALSVVERQRIIDALERCAGNQTRAAAQLGISRRALVSKLEQHALPRPRKNREE